MKSLNYSNFVGEYTLEQLQQTELLDKIEAGEYIAVLVDDDLYHIHSKP